jgi:hypothetical protein
MTTSVTDSSGASVGVYSGATSISAVGVGAGDAVGVGVGAAVGATAGAAVGVGAGVGAGATAGAANAAALAEAQVRIMAMPVTDENAALNIMVSFLNIAQRRGVFSIDESAKIWDCIKKFQKQ